MADVKAFLASLLSADGATRRAAEAHLAGLRRQPGAADALPLLLLAALSPAAVPDAAQRQMALVTLRGVLARGRPRLWRAASAPTREQVKAGLLAALGAEPAAPLRRNLCELVALLANTEFEDAAEAGSGAAGAARIGAAWPALWALIQQGSAAGAPHAAQEAALCLLERLAAFVGDHMEESFPALAAILLARMADEAAPLAAVRVQAAKAGVALLICARPSQAPHLLPLLQPLLQLLQFAVAGGGEREEQAVELISLLSDACEHRAPELKAALPRLLQDLCALAGAPSLAEDGDAVRGGADAAHGGVAVAVRKLAADCLCQLAEKAPALARGLPGNAFLRQALPVAAGFLLEHGLAVDGSPDEGLAAWERRTSQLAGVLEGGGGGGGGAEEPDEMDDEHRLVEVGEEFLRRLGHGIGSRRFVPDVDAALPARSSVGAARATVRRCSSRRRRTLVAPAAAPPPPPPPPPP